MYASAQEILDWKGKIGSKHETMCVLEHKKVWEQRLLHGSCIKTPT